MHSKQAAILAWIVLVGLILYASLFFLQKINLHTADIGRHIINGQVVKQEGLKSKVLSTNYYSEFQNDYPFINHHWLFGVWAYWVYQIGGWAGLVLANALLATLAIGTMAIFSAHQTSPAATTLAFFITLPLLTQRTEVRPETWSLLFMSLSFITIWLWFSSKLKFRWFLISQVVISIHWVNFHLFFVFNLFLLSSAMLSQWLSYIIKRLKKISHYQLSLELKRSLQITLTTTLATLVLILNPNLSSGLLAPFQIFNDYAYPVAENQTLWFYISHYPNRLHFGYGLGLVTLLIFGLLWWWRPRNLTRYTLLSQPLLIFTTIVVFGLIVLSLSLVRVLPFLALIAVPIIAFLITPLLPKLYQLLANLPAIGYAVLSSLFIGLLAIILATGIFLPYLPNSGVGLMTGSLLAGDFMKANPLPTPMFNNYDAGGYLINQLFTTNANPTNPKVFVDNRPEAYPGKFIKNDLIQAQKDEADWQITLDKYDFQSIFFYRHDATDWGQPFLIRRNLDENWVPVYVDEFAIIFVRNSPQNQAYLDQHRLPDDMFVVKEN